MRPLVLIAAVSLALVGCGKSEKDSNSSPKTPIELCAQLQAQGLVASCEAVDPAIDSNKDKPVAQVKATIVQPSKGADAKAAVDLFSFASKEEGERYIARRAEVTKRMQEVAATKARDMGFQPRVWTSTAYKSKSGTLFGVVRNPPDEQVSDQRTRVQAIIESAP